MFCNDKTCTCSWYWLNKHPTSEGGQGISGLPSTPDPRIAPHPAEQLEFDFSDTPTTAYAPSDAYLREQGMTREGWAACCELASAVYSDADYEAQADNVPAAFDPGVEDHSDCEQCTGYSEYDYETPVIDNVRSPVHYTSLDPEPLDVLLNWNLGFCESNAIKYIARAGVKDPTKWEEDLRKAIYYLERLIAHRSGQ